MNVQGGRCHRIKVGGLTMQPLISELKYFLQVHFTLKKGARHMYTVRKDPRVIQAWKTVILLSNPLGVMDDWLYLIRPKEE